MTPVKKRSFFLDLTALRVHLPPYPQVKLNSIGTKLFLYVLGGALIGLGGVSYLFYQAAETRAKDEIETTLRAQVRSIEGQLTQAEESVKGMGMAIKTTHASGIKDPETYKQLVFEFFKQRPGLIMGVGFGQAASQIVPSRTWFFPYFYVDQGAPEAVGKRLPPPYHHIRYSELFADDRYPEKPYYKVPVAAGKKVWLEPYDWYGISMTSLLVPFYDSDEQLLGVAGYDVNVTALSRQVNIPVTGKAGYFVILSQTGKLLAYPPDPTKAEVRSGHDQVPSLDQVWAETEGKLSGLLEVDGVFWAYRRITNTNWVMLAAVPKAVILGPVLVGTLAGTIGAAAVLGVVVAVFVYRLNHRLKPILEECNKLANSNRYHSSVVEAEPELDLSQQDEINVLATSFNRMAQQLRYSFAALEEANEALEQRVEQRTQELHEKNGHLEQALQNLQQAQLQLIQSEKMSSLGQLVAGVAHEINNPVNFIHGNLTYAYQYTKDLLKLLQLYQKYLPENVPEIQAETEAIDLEFLMQDLPKLLTSMQVGTDRIRQIVLSLRNFSRLDESDLKPVNLHEGIDSTLMILQNRLKAKSDHSEIEVMRDYGDLPKVECYAGQLNQVFMNILANAIDAIEEQQHTLSLEERRQRSGKITIQTRFIAPDSVTIRLADNGIGMSESVQKQIFDPFFTTKPAGKGTGLGMLISYQIVTEKHGGSLQCFSQPGEGTEFVITLPYRQR